MVLLTIVALPSEKIRLAENVGGAYVNCWINAGKNGDDVELAKKEAFKLIEKNGWKVDEVEAESIYDSEDDVPPDTKKYFQEAIGEGSCCVYHTWPTEEEGDTADLI